MVKECLEVKGMCEKCKYRKEIKGGYKCNLIKRILGRIRKWYERWLNVPIYNSRSGHCFD